MKNTYKVHLVVRKQLVDSFFKNAGWGSCKVIDEVVEAECPAAAIDAVWRARQARRADKVASFWDLEVVDLGLTHVKIVEK